MKYQFRRIQTWPRAFTKSRKSSPFSASYRSTMNLLETELHHLKARNVVVQLALLDSEIRLDGLPRASARPSHPGVIVSFDGLHGPISMPCDAFTHWEANLRAIALSLEALRKVDRYGVTRRGEQYSGWKTLPASGDTVSEGSPNGEGLKTREEAALFLAHISGEDSVYLLSDATSQQRAYRIAIKKTHPDSGGSHDDTVKLHRAMELLKTKA